MFLMGNYMNRVLTDKELRVLETAPELAVREDLRPVNTMFISFDGDYEKVVHGKDWRLYNLTYSKTLISALATTDS